MMMKTTGPETSQSFKNDVNNVLRLFFFFFTSQHTIGFNYHLKHQVMFYFANYAVIIIKYILTDSFI